MKFLTGAVIVLSALLLISPLLLQATSGSGSYVVTPGSGIPSGVVAVNAPIVSFWQLPLWVQVAGALDGILIAFGLMNAAPLIIGKIQNVLDNSNRLSIFNYVKSNPGCTPSEISSRQNMKNGTVKYHVQMLESQGKIILKRMGKYTRLFNTSKANTEQEKMVLAYIKNETSRNLLCAILEEPGLTNQRLAERFGLDKSSIHWHMERFLNDRLVTVEQDGRFKKYYIEPGVGKLLNNGQVMF
ncbi:MAG TPA: winged helix-turn-helix transcriptional regulator [Methanocella sp.]|uniref:winged helix-turn-helix transcriptional regulator n=1 Tax=Methanocella sp. TaxID=2052833 RepID=UPI002C147C66|nr:winged helix-turn-helix transcriptional regulator [Methanocella sp.]HTY91348.1 winged helix-turn-helix transcriptional regulator [Methanocella sp.]